MAATSEEKKKRCQTVIPADWPKFTGPEYVDGMTPAQARRAWYDFVRAAQRVGPTPRVYRSDPVR